MTLLELVQSLKVDVEALRMWLRRLEGRVENLLAVVGVDEEEAEEHAEEVSHVVSEYEDEEPVLHGRFVIISEQAKPKQGESRKKTRVMYLAEHSDGYSWVEDPKMATRFCSWKVARDALAELKPLNGFRKPQVKDRLQA
jgi:hypothetical protein